MHYDGRTPAISSPQQGAKFVVGQDVSAAFDCVDESSGIQSCEASASKIDTSSAGAHSYVVTAMDVAGNTKQLTVSYTVFTKLTYNLVVNAAPNGGGPALHMWAVVRSNNGTIVQTGFTPLTFSGQAGSTYIVTVSDYQSIKFASWENASTGRDRAFTLSSDVTAIANYDAGSMLRGFTSLTFAGTTAQPDLAVNAQSMADDHALHMWTTISAGASTSAGTQYVVTVQDYLDRHFDHWDDGSTDRTRTLTISSASTITAYYQTG